MALLANLQRDLQVYSARLTALEEQNRSLKDAVLQIRCELSSSALIATAPQKKHSLLGTGTALFTKMSEQAAASSGRSSVKDFYFLLQATGLLPSPEALFATLLLKNGMASLDCISGDAGKLNEECSVFYELQPVKKRTRFRCIVGDALRRSNGWLTSWLLSASVGLSYLSRLLYR